MNYSKKAEEIRQAMKPVRIQAGKWLIADMKKAWDRGETRYVIPPGTYWLSEPVPVACGSSADGMNKVVLHCPVLNYFVEYPTVVRTYEAIAAPYRETVIRLNHVRLGFDN